MKNVSFGRKYDKRDTKEGMPLERFLERRKLDLVSWLMDNKIKSVVDAEEKVKTLGICITAKSLQDIIDYFEKPIQPDVVAVLEIEAESSTEEPQEKQRRKKQTTGQHPNTL